MHTPRGDVLRRSLGNIIPIRVHNLGPSSHKVTNQLLLTASLGICLSRGAQLSVRAKDKIHAGTGPLLVTCLAVDTLEEIAVADLLPLGAHVEKVDEEVVVGVERAQTADESGDLGHAEAKELGAVDEHVLKLDAVSGGAVVAESVGGGLQVGGGLDIGLFLCSVGAAGDEGHGDVNTGVLGGLLDGGRTSQDDDVGKGDGLAAGLGVVELLLDALEAGEDLAQLSGVVHLPVLLGLETDASTVGSTAEVAASEGRCRSPGSGDELGDVNAGLEDLSLDGRDVTIIDELVVTLRDGVLPDEDLLGDIRAKVALTGTHITMCELEPSLGERIIELLRVLKESSRDLLILGVEAQRQISRQHGWLLLLGGVVGVRHGGFCVLGNPLVGAGRALCELPLELEEVLEVVVAPLDGSAGPGDLETTGGGVRALACLVAVGPAEALLGEVGGFGLGADMTVVSSSERLLEVSGVNVLVRTLLRVGSTRLVGSLVSVGVTNVVSKPGILATVVGSLIGLPGILSASGEASGLEAHVLEGDVAGEDDEIGP
ncbi:hypothetical protein HG530_006637 [Fusarium avenaceum]|nr:hypothetical protein HG530_006637 [Fusarium avenaceum]